MTRARVGAGLTLLALCFTACGHYAPPIHPKPVPVDGIAAPDPESSDAADDEEGRPHAP